MASPNICSASPFPYTSALSKLHSESIGKINSDDDGDDHDGYDGYDNDGV